MKPLFLYFSFLLLFTSCEKVKDEAIVVEPTPTFHAFQGEIGSNDNSTVVTIDNHLLICGNSASNICILKVTKTGSQVWRKAFYAGSGSRASGIAQLTEDELFICGTTYRNDLNSKSDVLLIKTNSIGDTLWTKNFGGSQADDGYYIITTQDGNLLVCGTTASPVSKDLIGIFLVKTNSIGDTIWTKTYFETASTDPYHVMQTKNGEFLITGSIEVSDSIKQVYLLKLSSTGAPIWNKKIGQVGWQTGLSTVESSNGDLVTCGQIKEDDQNQILLLKTDGVGNEYWVKDYGAVVFSERGNAVKINEDGTFVITGTSDNPTGRSEIVLLKIDHNGNELFLKRFGGKFIDYGQNIIKEDNDDYIITGQYNGAIFMTRTDNGGVFK